MAPLTDEQRDLAGKNFRLIYFVLRMFPGLDEDEAVSRGHLVLCMSAKYFKADRGTFSNYACRNLIRAFAEVRAAQDEHRRERRRRDDLRSLDEMPAAPEGDRVERGELYDLAIATLDTRERFVVTRRLAGDKNHEVGAVLGIGKQRVKQIRKAAIEKCRDALTAA